MTSFTFFWNQLMSIMVFAGMFISIALVYCLVLPKTKFSITIHKFVSKQILVLGFLLTFAGVVSSLVYSEYIGYAPCMLCWFARVAFYPQAILFAMAFFKHDKKILDYTFGLTIFGLIVSVYHYTVETVGYSPLPCSAQVSCLTRYVYEYGFITIPFMGVVLFTTLLLMHLMAKKALKQA